MVTLCLVLGGTAFAANSVATVKHGDKKADTKLIKKMAPTLSVKHAKTADTATSAATAAHADSATNATNASDAAALGGVAAASFAPVVYAHIRADGTVDASQSKGITDAMVHRRNIAAFCITGLPFTPKNGTVTVDYGLDADGSKELAQLQIASSGTALNCNTGENVEIATSSASGTFAPEPFYLVLFG